MRTSSIFSSFIAYQTSFGFFFVSSASIGGWSDDDVATALANGTGAGAGGGKDKKGKAPEKPKELEEDASADSRPKLPPSTATFFTEDTTLNVMPVADGALLTALGEGGMAHLVAAARANVGVKSGRYMFEARVVENLSVLDQGAKQWGQVRLGFSTSGSSLFLSDSDAETSEITFGDIKKEHMASELFWVPVTEIGRAHV